MKRAFFALNTGSMRTAQAVWVWIVGALGLLLFISLALITYVKNDTVNEQRARESDLRRQVNSLQAIKKQYQELETRIQGLQKKIGKIDKLAGGGVRTLHDDLAAIAHDIPDDALLRTLTFDTHWIELEGSARTVHAITAFTTALSKNARFKEPRLLAVGDGQKNDDKLAAKQLPITFKIRLQRIG